MANSSSDFNEPEFIEYDPTPYDGGFDIAATYGKPLPPSDAICYPHSVSNANASPSLNGISDGPVTHPNGKGSVDQATSPGNSPEETRPYKEDEEEKPWSNGNWLIDPNFDHWGGGIFSGGYGICDSGQGYDYGKPNSYHEDGYSGIEVPQHGYDYDYYPWSGCGNGEEPKSQSQRGYSRDDLGPCAALFDYWPCLYRKDQKSYGQHEDVENCYGNQWKEAADYLFGSSNPHGERRDEGVSYGYQKHYPEQPYSVQYAYNEQPWSGNIGYCEPYQEEPEQLYSVQYAYNEQPWSQNIGFCETYHEEVRPPSNYALQGEDCYGGNDEYFHHRQLKYSHFDE